MGKKGQQKKAPQNSGSMRNVVKDAGDKKKKNDVIDGLVKEQIASAFGTGVEGDAAADELGYEGNIDEWVKSEEGANYIATVRQKLSESIDEKTVYGGCASGGSEINTRSGFNPCDSNYDIDKATDFLKEQIENAQKSASSEILLPLLADAAEFTLRDLLDPFVSRDADDYTDTEKAAAAAAQADFDASRKYTQGRQVSFKEQCFLLTNILAFANAKTALDLDPSTTPGAYSKEFPQLGTLGAKGNRSIMLHGEPFSFINKLTQSPTKSFLHSMGVEEISALQPSIRLFKVITDTEGKEYEVEVQFDSHYSQFDVNNLLEDKRVRGHGVGIKSFNFGYEASNPFAIKKSIKAKLVIFANTFGELLANRGGFYYAKDAQGNTIKESHVYKYTDLALKTGGNAFLKRVTNSSQSNVALMNAEKLNFRLKAVLGWADPRGNGGLKTSTLQSGTIDAIYNSFITINLTPTIHDFDIDDLGRVTFSLNYLAYIEDFFDQPTFDVFASPEDIASQTARKVKIAALETKCGSKNVSEAKNDPDEKEKIEEEKLKNLRSLMNSLINKNRLRIIDVPIDDLNKYRKGGPTSSGRVSRTILDRFINNIKTVGDSATSDQDDAADRQITRGTAGPNDPADGAEGSTTQTASAADIESVLGASNPIESVTFFWVSDLIDVILENIGDSIEKVPAALVTEYNNALKQGQPASVTDAILEEIRNYNRYIENYKRMRVVLGPLELIDENLEGQVAATSISNLGDIPVSGKYFMEWLTTSMLKTERSRYPLGSFLNDFFNKFIRDFLNNDPCYGGSVKQKIRVGQTAITAYRSTTKSPFQEDLETYARSSGYPIVDIKNLPSPVLNVMGRRGGVQSNLGISEEFNYMAYYASRVQPLDLLNGNRGQDEGRGIFHYGIGRDRGIIKSISLSKTNTPGLTEVRFEQEGYDGLQQLLVLYDANIKTYLDVTAFPGNYIYVEPKSFDPALDYDITKLGVGGYYMITRADHSLGPGLAETSITAKWVAQVNREAEQLSQQNSKECQDLLDSRKQTVTLNNKKSWLQLLGLGS